MKNLGKIVLLLLTLHTILYARVDAKLDARAVEVGEIVTYSLHIMGKDIQRPRLSKICGYPIISTGSQASIEMNGGDIRRTNIFSYKFVPQKSCTIEATQVEVDGKLELSNAVELKVSEAVVTKDSDFIITLETPSKEVFVSQPFEMTLIFKQRRDAQAIDSKFEAPTMKGFWIKNESQPRRTQSATHTTTKITYTISAQRIGALKITPAKMQIANRVKSRDSWGAFVPRLRWKTYFSNELDITVKALPADVDLIGNFSITASVDKQIIQVNEAVNLVIKVIGDGNLEDIHSFKPQNDLVSIFDEKIVIKGTVLTQKIAFVGDDDFVIPAMELKFYNPKTKSIETVVTKAIPITVKNAKQEAELNIQRDKPIVKQKMVVQQNPLSFAWIILALIVGIGIGVLLGIYKPWMILKRSKNDNFSIKDHKQLLIKLLAYQDDEQVKQLIIDIEKSIYTDEKIEIDKNLIKEMVKKYAIS